MIAAPRWHAVPGPGLRTQGLTLMLCLLTGGPAMATARVLTGGLGDLQAVADQCADGDTLTLRDGTWRGPLTLRRRVTLIGERAVLAGGGEGTVLRIDAPAAVVRDLEIRDSGTDLSGPDACVYLTARAENAAVRGCRLSGCGFGIWVHQSRGAHIEDNVVIGTEVGHRSRRGNGIHLFDGSALVVRGNLVTGGRDGIYVSATEDSLIEGNRLYRTRYGVHYMFSYRNTLRDNVAVHNGGGYAIMQSMALKVHGNVALDNEGYGILFRDVQDSDIRANRLQRNGQGLFFFSSTANVIADNRVLDNAIGAKIWAGSVRNDIHGNLFSGNRRQVFYVASQDLELGVERSGNLWSDYLGWDQDGDGVGDRPYRVDSFSSHLLHRFPAAALLLRSPTLELLAHVEGQMPVLRVATVIDRQPLVKGRQP